MVPNNVMMDVDSSVFNKVGFMDDNIIFMMKNGNVYSYDAFPASEHYDMMDGRSLGVYYNKRIKGKLDCTHHGRAE